MRALWLILLVPWLASAQLATTPGGGVMWYKAPVVSVGGLAIVQTNQCPDSGGTKSTNTITATSAGNLLVMAYSIFGNGGAHGSTSAWDINAVTDNQGGTWTQIGSIESAAGAADDFFVGIWYQKNCAANITRITNSSTSGTYIGSVVYEISGASSSAPFTSGEFATSASSGATTNPQSTLTTATANSLLIAICSNNGSGTVTMSLNGTGTTGGTWLLGKADLNGANIQIYSSPYIKESGTGTFVHGWTTASFWSTTMVAAFHP